MTLEYPAPQAPVSESEMTVGEDRVRVKRILCVDFDGVVNSYVSPWVDDVTIPDAPVSGALVWLWEASRFFTVCIYSSRSKTQAGIDAMKAWIRHHAGTAMGEDFADALLDVLTFASTKPAAFLTIDDRALTFEGDFSAFDPKALLAFKPWNKRA